MKRTIEPAGQDDVPALRLLWQEAFGDTDDFLDDFFRTAFSPRRNRCIREDNFPLAQLFWLDLCCRDRKMAYLYAIATRTTHRKQGLCRLLVEDTCLELSRQGYAGAVLIPAEEPLARMYETMGFSFCSGIGEFSAEAGDHGVPAKELEPSEYVRRAGLLLPPGSAEPDPEYLPFLLAQARLYGGENWVMAARQEEDHLECLQLLGDTQLAPGILRTLEVKSGSFRCPGNDRPFAMYRSLDGVTPPPAYFAMAFD